MKRIKIMDSYTTTFGELIEDKLDAISCLDRESIIDHGTNGAVQIVYPISKSLEKSAINYDVVVLFPASSKQWDVRKHMLTEWHEGNDQISYYKQLAEKKYPGVPFVVVAGPNHDINDPEIKVVEILNKSNEGDFADIILKMLEELKHALENEKKENKQNRCNLM